MDLPGKTVIMLIFLALAITDVYARCPPKNQVRGPECREDYDCHKGPCCPNYLGKKSCVNTVPYRSSGLANRVGVFHRHEGIHKRSTGSGSYCNGVKCMPFQVCQTERYTGKLRCHSP